MDHGAQVIEAVADACAKWGIAEYVTRVDYELIISSAPGQSFDIEIVDEGDEAILFVNAASYHAHLDRFTSPEAAVTIVKDLLSGESSLIAQFQGSRWVESHISDGKNGPVSAPRGCNPFGRFAPSRRETLESKVVLLDEESE